MRTSKRISKFKTIYWGKDKSTEALFEIDETMPPVELITTCFLIPIYKGKLVITRFASGWGFPGGHREQGESGEECVRRESFEESAITLKQLLFVGRWKAQKIISTIENAQYPDIAYQLLYIAEVEELKEFKPTEGFFERKLIFKDELSKFHAKYHYYGDVYSYVLDNYPL